MSLEFAPLYDSPHLVSEGYVKLEIPFSGNLLSFTVDAPALLDRLNEQIGILYQYKGDQGNAYRIYAEKSVIQLALPQTDLLIFFPTSTAFSSYQLTIKYATLGVVIGSPNATPLPQLITELPSRVSVLESELNSMVSPTWASLEGKPSVFPPDSHNHSIAEISNLQTALNGIYDINQFQAEELDNLGTRLTTLETSPATSSQKYIALSANAQLESNKSYIATVNNLTCTLPLSPAIGDFVDLANGNFPSFRVNHGNSSQLILNNLTQTVLGSNSGIILKAYSAITLVFMGGNLWVSINRNRSINNWQEPTLETSATSKPFTFVAQNISLNEMYDGNEATNTNPNANDGWASFSLSGSHFIDSLRVITGQSNGWFNYPTQLRVYAGNGIGGTLLGDFPITQETQVFTLSTPFEGNLITTRFSRSGSPMTIKDLKIFTRSVTGGEISVI